MQTFIDQETLESKEGKEAQRILRKCVHCGFCTATCPTYQLRGDELDSPRGRIYLIKGLFEGKSADEKTRLHLDRCLTCRSCETTCPSGVDYGHLIDLGREKVDQELPRSFTDKATRWLLRQVIPYPKRFGFLLKTGQFFKPVLPGFLAKQIPSVQASLNYNAAVEEEKHDRATLSRKMIVLEGCVQPALTPNTNAAARKVLALCGIDLVSVNEAGCCGSVDQHLAASDRAKVMMRRNIDVWWPQIESGAEAIVITASGCGAMVKDYAYHLKDDPVYAEKAQRVSELACDLLEVIETLLSTASLNTLRDRISEKHAKPIACQVPCSLQHGQQLGGRLEKLLVNCGFSLTSVKDSHLCCGSAGTYSILQKDLATPLRENKLRHLQAGKPDVIVSANIGCQTYLQEKADVPVRHWIELLAEAI